MRAPAKRMGLRQRAQDCQRRKARQPGGEAGAARPFDVRLVDHDDGFAVEGAHDRLERAESSRFPVGLFGEHRYTIFTSRPPGGQQPLRIHTPAVRALERDLDHARPLDARGHLIHAEGRYALQYRIGAGAQVDARQQIDGFVAPMGREQATRRHLVQCGEALEQRRRLRFGIAVESGGGGIAGRPPRRLIGMQSGHRRQPGGVRIRLEAEYFRSRQREHRIHEHRALERGALFERIQADRHGRGMRVQPFEVRQHSARFRSTPEGPAGVSSCTVMRF